MTAPWTARERALRAALRVAETSLKRINSKASRKLSSECCGDAVTLVKITIECEKATAAIRADPPLPDPRDEALRLAEAELLRLWTLVPPGCAGVGGVRTIALEDDDVARLRQIVDVIRAAKGGNQ